MMDNARTHLADPRSSCPGDSQLLQKTCLHIRVLLRAKQNVSNQWNFGETFVDITPGEDTYQITDAAFGTPLVVTTVPENTNQIVRIIPFSCPQNLNYSWGYSQNSAAFWPSYDGSNCNAMRCAIFWQNNLPYIRFLPTPEMSPASYKIQFLQNANQVGIASLNSSPLMDQDCDLVEVRTAKSLLAVAEWDGNNGPQNAEKRKDLFVTLGNDEKLTYEQFLIANRLTTGPKITNRWSTVEV
jgi:hypothetical protein